MRLIRQARRALKIGRNTAVRLVKAWQWQPAVPPLRRKQQLLIVREEALGDVLLATPIVREIRRQHPDAYITFLTNWKSEELLAGNPDIDEVVVNKTHLAGRRFDKTFELWYEYEPDLHIVDAYARRL